jgi:hypothetical protein
MKDDFLYTSRPPVRKAFSDSLYQRLSIQYPDNQFQRKGVKFLKYSVTHLFKWEYALLALMVVAALGVTLSAPVRAKTLELIRTVAGFNVAEQKESPIKEAGENDISATQTVIISSPGLVETGSATPTAMEPTIYSIPTLMLPKVLKNPPFQFGLPTWVPEGYVLDQNVGIANSKSWVSLVWSNSDLSEIEMLVEREYTGYNIPAGENSSEEIKINGQPALLVRGFWHEQQWDPKRGIVIGWSKDGHFYRLTYSQREPSHNEIVPIEGDMEAKIAELVRMAESIP